MQPTGQMTAAVPHRPHSTNSGMTTYQDFPQSATEYIVARGTTKVVVEDAFGNRAVVDTFFEFFIKIQDHSVLADCTILYSQHLSFLSFLYCALDHPTTRMEYKSTKSIFSSSTRKNWRGRLMSDTIPSFSTSWKLE